MVRFTARSAIYFGAVIGWIATVISIKVAATSINNLTENHRAVAC